MEANVKENALVQIISASGLEQDKKEYILAKFDEFTAIADEWGERVKSIVVSDETQTDLMKQAREGRLLLKDKRVSIEKTRKALKEQSLKEGQAIDAIAKKLTALIEPLESYLDDQEKFAERKAELRKNELRTQRSSEIQPYLEFIVANVDLGTLSDSDYTKLLNGAKLQLQAKIDTEKRIEQERIEREKAEKQEQERIRLENEVLRKEREEQQKLIEAERKKVDDERRAQELANKKQQDIANAQIKKEREEREKLEKELRQKEETENKRIADEKKKADEEERQRKLAEKKAAKAPDKAKLLLMRDTISISYPDLKSEEANRVLDTFKKNINDAIELLVKQINTL